MITQYEYNASVGLIDILFCQCNRQCGQIVWQIRIVFINVRNIVKQPEEVKLIKRDTTIVFLNLSKNDYQVLIRLFEFSFMSL